MQSSVRAATSRTIRPPSNGAIPIGREKPFISSRGNCEEKRGEIHRKNLSIKEGQYDMHGRLYLTGGQDEFQLAPFKSRTGMLEQSLKSPSQDKFERQSPQDLVLLESNRQSMKELSNFLRDKEPPPDNLMSIPYSDEISVNDRKSKPVFKLFQRKNSKKSRVPSLLQLPDTAVAARTRSGFRHIAISIPIEYDHLDYLSPPKYSTSRCANLRPMLAFERHDRAVITVLKPVAEILESGGSLHSTGNNDLNHKSGSVQPSSAEVLGAEPAKMLRNSYPGIDEQKKQLLLEKSTATTPNVSRSQKPYAAIPNAAVFRYHSQQSDLRHSGGTLYSERTLVTIPDHSREGSSVTTAPSATLASSKALTPPPRSLNVPKGPNTSNREHLSSSPLLKPQRIREDCPKSSILSITPANDSVASFHSTKPAAVPLPKTGQGYNAAENIDVESFCEKKRTPPLGAAPTRKLPELPRNYEGKNLLTSRLATVPPTRTRKPLLDVKSSPLLQKASSLSERKNTEKAALAAHQSRQERVKERKRRDMMAMMHNSGTILPSVEGSGMPNCKLNHSRRRSLSASCLKTDLTRRRSPNIVTPIMVVADLVPLIHGPHLDNSFAHVQVPHTTHKSRNSNINGSLMQGARSLPRSGTSPVDCEDKSTHTFQKRSSGSSLQPPRSGLDIRRQERRTKRNRLLREKELDQRLARVEKDNAILIHTLTSISKSFNELNKVIPEQCRAKRMNALLAAAPDASASNCLDGAEAMV